MRLTKSWSFLGAKGHQIDPSHTYFHRTRLSYEEPQGGLEDGRNSGHRQAILQIKNICIVVLHIVWYNWVYVFGSQNLGARQIFTLIWVTLGFLGSQFSETVVILCSIRRDQSPIPTTKRRCSQAALLNDWSALAKLVELQQLKKKPRLLKAKTFGKIFLENLNEMTWHFSSVWILWLS